MSRNSKISVIITSYNYGVYLSECIDSLKIQTITPHEIIVVDDGSTDETESIVNSFKNINLLYFYQDNQGACTARNKGYKEASGEYLIFLDADDKLMPHALESMLSCFQQNNEFGIIFSDYVWVDETGKKIRKESTHRSYYKGWIYNELKHETFIAPSSALIHRSCLDQGILFDENLLCFQDWDFFYRLSEYWQFGYVDDVLMEYRIHPSVSGIWNDSLQNKIEKTSITLNYLRKKYKNKKKEIPTVVDYALAGLYIENNEFEKALSVVKKGLSVDSENYFLAKRMTDLEYALHENAEKSIYDYCRLIDAVEKNTPLYYEILLQKGKVFLENGKLQNAEENFDQILKDEKSSHKIIYNEALLNKGIIHHDLEDYNEANRLLSKIISSSDEPGFLRTALIYSAKCLTSLGNFHGAEIIINNYVNKFSDEDSEIFSIRAVLSEKNGEKLKAVKFYNNSLRMDSSKTVSSSVEGIIRILKLEKEGLKKYFFYLINKSIVGPQDLLYLCETYEQVMLPEISDFYELVIKKHREKQNSDKTEFESLIGAFSYWKVDKSLLSLKILNRSLKKKGHRFLMKSCSMMVDILMLSKNVGYKGMKKYINYLAKINALSIEEAIRIEYRIASNFENTSPETALRIFISLTNKTDLLNPMNSSLSAGIFYHLGVISFEMGKIDEADRYFSTCINYLPHHVSAQNYLKKTGRILDGLKNQINV